MAAQVLSCVTIRNIALATDFAPVSERPLQHALAAARHFGATLHFLHIVRPSQFVYAPDMIPAADEVASRDFDSFLSELKRVHRLDGIDYRHWVLEGEISQVAREFVDSHQIDLLILGTHGRAGLPRLLLGSIAQEVFHYVGCPVLTVGPCCAGAGVRPKITRVLFSTDLSGESLAAIPYVLTTVRDWHAELDVVHVCSTPNEACSRLLDGLREKFQALAEQGAPPVRYQLLVGNPATRVTEYVTQNKVDFIVLGLRPRRGLYNGPLWSHAYEIVRHAPCPVLSVRSSAPPRVLVPYAEEVAAGETPVAGELR